MAAKTPTKDQCADGAKGFALPDRLARIGEAARLAGLHPETVRRLEARGLISPRRTWSGQRRYRAEDILRLRRLAGLPEGG